MKSLRVCVLLVLALLTSSCARTIYTNLSPEQGAAHRHDAADRSGPSSWQSFFLYGWVPGELVIDAAGSCGGSEHVARIETRQSFVQGLVQAVAGYIINVYAPYTGWVVCDHQNSLLVEPPP